MIDLNFKYKILLDYIEKISPFKPELSIILGSGLGDFARSLKIIKSISTEDLPGYPRTTIPGHAGKIHFCIYSKKKLLLFQGRVHFYEGYNISDCVLAPLISKKVGCRNLLITNAAGGINKNFYPGNLMLAKSFNGLFIKKEITNLIGLANIEKKNQMINFPSKKLNEIIKKSALEEKIDLKEGVYWYTKGPSYETPAEIKMMLKFGADAVGMSTVHEAVFASFIGLEVSSISCITNFAAGISPKKLNHSEVTETANLVRNKFENLVKRIITQN